MEVIPECKDDTLELLDGGGNNWIGCCGKLTGCGKGCGCCCTELSSANSSVLDAVPTPMASDKAFMVSMLKPLASINSSFTVPLGFRMMTMFWPLAAAPPAAAIASCSTSTVS